MFRAVGVGDLHLTDDGGKGGLANYIDEPDVYVMSEVQRVLNWARKKGITNCFFYGDLCENPRLSYAAMTAFTQTIRENPDIEFVAYLGNHDKLGKESSEGHSLEIIKLMQLGNLKIVTEDKYLKFGKTKVKVCPWPSVDFDPEVLNFGHIEVKGSKGDSGRVMDSDDLVKSKAVVCMGHLHTPHQVRSTYYSGTLYQTNFGESLPKGFHLIEWTSIDDYEIHQIPFKPRYKLHNCVVETQADVDALPTGDTDLIKLVVKDGADVTIPDRRNIVINKAFKTKNELAQILTEDLMDGSELVVRTADFFKEWIEQQAIPEALKQRTKVVRKRILGASK
jgi:hypothetical protein